MIIFWFGLFIYSAVLTIAVWFDMRETLNGKIVNNFLVIVTIVLSNTLATLFILMIRKQIITKMAMKESSNHIIMNLLLFGLVNFFLLASLAAISCARRKNSSPLN